MVKSQSYQLPHLPYPGVNCRDRDLQVCWEGECVKIVEVLQQRPIAIVLKVEWHDKTDRVIKIVSQLLSQFKWNS